MISRTIGRAVATMGLVTAGALAIGAAPAWAAPTLTVSTFVQDPGNPVGCQAQYLSASGGSSFCSSSGIGSNSVTPIAGGLSASATSSLVDGNTGAAIAAVDTATGALQASIATDKAARGFAGAQVVDTVHYVVAGASPTTVTPLTFQVSEKDTLALDPNGYFGGGGSTSVAFQVFISGGTGALAGAGLNERASIYPSGPSVTGYSDGDIDFTQNDTTGIAATLVIDVAGASGDLGLVAILGCDVGYDSDCSAAGGAGGSAYGFVRQAGVTLTEDALRFPGAPSAAPEPVAWALMLIGFGFIGAAARRRHALAISQGLRALR